MREFQRVLLKTGLGEGLRPRWAQPILILRARNRSHTESQQEQKERGGSHATPVVGSQLHADAGLATSLPDGAGGSGLQHHGAIVPLLGKLGRGVLRGVERGLGGAACYTTRVLDAE